eukprot:101886_1
MSNNKVHSEYAMHIIYGILKTRLKTRLKNAKMTKQLTPIRNTSKLSCTTPTINYIHNVIVSNYIFTNLQHQDIISCMKVCRKFYISATKYPNCFTNIIAPKNSNPITKFLRNYGNAFTIGARIAALSQFSSIQQLKIRGTDMITASAQKWHFKKLKSLEIESANLLHRQQSILLQFDRLWGSKINANEIKDLKICNEWSNISLPQFFDCLKKFSKIEHLTLYNITIRGEMGKYLTAPYLELPSTFMNTLNELILHKIDSRLVATLLNHIGYWIRTLKMSSNVDLNYFVIDETSEIFDYLTFFRYDVEPRAILSANTINNLHKIVQKDNLIRFSLSGVVGHVAENILFNAISNKQKLILRVEKLVQLRDIQNVLRRIRNDINIEPPQELQIFCTNEWVNNQNVFNHVKQCIDELMLCVDIDDDGKFEIIVNMPQGLVDLYVEYMDEQYDDKVSWQTGDGSNNVWQVRISNTYVETMENVNKTFL